MFEPVEVDLWLVFRNTVGVRKPWWDWLKDGFEHVEIWREARGAWARLEPAVTVSTLEVWLKPPWEVIPPGWQATCLRVRRTLREPRVRVPWHTGPLTCVDGAKAFMGIWAPFVWTPWQLYNYCIGRFDCELAEGDTGHDARQSDTPGQPAAAGAEAEGPGCLPVGAPSDPGGVPQADDRWLAYPHGRFVRRT